MTMTLAELDDQDITLLPERATLHRGGSINVVYTRQTVIAEVFSLGNHDSNSATAVAVNL